MRFIFALLLVAVASQVNADIVLRDNLSDSSNWNQNASLEDTSNIAGQGGVNSALDSAIGLSFVGNGNSLGTIEVIFQYSGDFVPDQGPIESVDWLVGVYLDPTRFSIEGITGNAVTEAPDYLIPVPDPTNADYLVPVGNIDGQNNYHAIADVSAFNFQTISGQEHLAFLIPHTPPNTGLESWLAVSNDTGHTTGVGTDYIDFSPTTAIPPQPSATAAFRMTMSPPESPLRSPNPAACC